MDTIAATAPTATLSGSKLYALIGVCGAIALLEGFDLLTISIAAPVMMPGLGIDKIQTGQIFAGGQTGLVIGGLLGGLAGDKLGRRNTLLLGVLCFGLFCTLTVNATGFESLILARGLTGVGIGLALPNLISMAAECAPPKHRAKTISIILAGLPAGGMTVALAGSTILAAWGWRGLFYIGGLLPLAIAPLIFLLPKYQAAHPGRSGEPRPHWLRALFGEGRGFTTLLLWISLLLTAAVLYMMVNWLPSLMTQRGYEIRISHLASAMFSLGGTIGSFSAGFFVDRYGYRRVLPLLYAGVLLGIGGIALMSSVPIILLSAGILGVFVVGSFYSLNGASPLYYPAAERGFCTGASVGMGRIGSILGPLMGGYVLKLGFGPAVAGPAAVATAAIPLVLVACAAVFLLTRREFAAVGLTKVAG
jgi:MFS transporter, AAHS family, 3-hydroxyphenylpropionic acid transporter